jgi:hypothetical protein
VTTGGVVLRLGDVIPSGVVVVTDIYHRPVLFVTEDSSEHTVLCFLRIDPNMDLEEHEPVHETDDMTHDLIGIRTDPSLN